jgi:mono/diheme cytochrome c family protein
MLPAPPHDPSGHTWQHSDAELYRLVADSVYPFAAPGYHSAMPAFAGRLSHAEIEAVLAYIKSTWPPGIRAYQAAQNPDGPPLTNLPGDWHFPATCDYHLGPIRKP